MRVIFMLLALTLVIPSLTSDAAFAQVRGGKSCSDSNCN